jgi:hypothetical protein
MIESLNVLGFIGICFAGAIAIPTMIGISLLLWQWVVCSIRTELGVELAVMDYLRNKKRYVQWKNQQHD